MSLLSSLLIALSTYSSIKVPQLDWSQKNMKYTMAFLPVVGILIAGAVYLWYLLAEYLKLNVLLFSAVSVAIPILLSGGIHLDGFMDTVDALSSHRSKEDKLMILKDPHTGAFSVMYLVVYVLGSFGLVSELYDKKTLSLLVLSFVLSRILCALSTLLIQKARNSGMLVSAIKDVRKNPVLSILVVELMLVLSLTFWQSLSLGLLFTLVSIISFFLYKRTMLREFGGITGDTSGFYLQLLELSFLLATVAVSFL